MKKSIQKVIILSGTVLYLMTPAYVPGASASVGVVIADNGESATLGGVMQPQGDPFPICPQCT